MCSSCPAKWGIPAKLWPFHFGIKLLRSSQPWRNHQDVFIVHPAQPFELWPQQIAMKHRSSAKLLRSIKRMTRYLSSVITRTESPSSNSFPWHTLAKYNLRRFKKIAQNSEWKTIRTKKARTDWKHEKNWIFYLGVIHFSIVCVGICTRTFLVNNVYIICIATLEVNIYWWGHHPSRVAKSGPVEFGP